MMSISVESREVGDCLMQPIQNCSSSQAISSSTLWAFSSSPETYKPCLQHEIYISLGLEELPIDTECSVTRC